MAENKATIRDRVNIAKTIAENENVAVKPVLDKAKDVQSGIALIKTKVEAARALFLEKKAAEVKVEEVVVEPTVTETVKVEETVPETPTSPNQVEPDAFGEEEKPEISDITGIRVEDFIGTSKPKKPENKPNNINVSTATNSNRFSSNKPMNSNANDRQTNNSGSQKKNSGNNNNSTKKKGFEEKKTLNKREKVKRGYEDNHASVEYDETTGEIMKIRVRKSNNEKKKHVVPQQMVIDHAVITTENITIKQLSEKIGKSAPEIIKKLFLEFSIIKTINDTIDYDTAELIAAEFNVTLELKLEQTSEEKLFMMHKDDDDDDAAALFRRPPIVTIMGHVDHGKTSILDYIRKSNVASGEAGGITQHIGAYTIKVPYGGETRQITFLDTPGHEAFTAMRQRGANITDIVIIVVAADDGIMPQTIEAINHAKAAKVPIIVAINKMDKVGANPDRILQQLADNGLVVEDWGGDVPCVRVSAKTGENINLLLETLLTVADIGDFKANPDRPARGTIIEAKLDKGKGTVATVLVQNGTLKVGNYIVAGTTIGRVRAMFDDKGNKVNEALPSMPVSILGLQNVPNAGDQLMAVDDEKLSRQVAEERMARERSERSMTKKASLEDVFSRIEEGKLKDLNLIIKADVQGSVEAVKQSLLKLSNDEVKVHVIHSGVGAINESDVALADTANAIIIGFNIRPDSNARNTAEKIGVDIRLYRIIYDAIDDVENAIKGMLAPTYSEQYLGRAEVRQIYKISSVGTIAGCMVKDGKITRNAKVRLLRNGVVITETQIASLRRIKDDVKEVIAGFDCGIGLDKYSDIHVDDVIEAYTIEENRL